MLGLQSKGKSIRVDMWMLLTYYREVLIKSDYRNWIF